MQQDHPKKVSFYLDLESWVGYLMETVRWATLLLNFSFLESFFPCFCFLKGGGFGWMIISCALVSGKIETNKVGNLVIFAQIQSPNSGKKKGFRILVVTFTAIKEKRQDLI